MQMLFLGIVMAIISSLVLKMLNRIYIQHIVQIEDVKELNLLVDTPSYEQFQRVSKECSVPNQPIRDTGDFVDFIIENIDSSECGIENKILVMNYGEEDDE